MKEYIEKEKLFDCLDIKNALGGQYGISLTAINAIPAADVVEVRHGRWIFDFALDGSNFYRCSECGRQECLLAKYNMREFAPYCHCGAKMDGGVNRVDFGTVKNGGVNDGKA